MAEVTAYEIRHITKSVGLPKAARWVALIYGTRQRHAFDVLSRGTRGKAIDICIRVEG